MHVRAREAQGEREGVKKGDTCVCVCVCVCVHVLML